MKSEARNRLRNIVGNARKIVEEDIQSQLLRLGIKESELIPIGQLEYLSDALIENRRRIEEAIEKEKLGNISQREAFERYVRHVGFTFINRVAAFKALAVRNLLSRETITRREKYAGYSAREYEVSEREGINDPEEIAKIAFRKACEEISEEIAVLFDLSDEYSILFPSTRVMTQVYEYFGKDIPDEDWLSDDVIGWIYQYYNSEARKEFRKKKRKPKPDDIPIINQFYTPDWIVKALVDNTLGRLWLESKGEMYKVGEGLNKAKKASVKGFCDYIVPENTESRRDQIDPHEIKILDPACGSGHFLVYAFDVLFLIYREYDSSLSDEQICECIIENNLYGIDIDLRAVQLAALSLYLKAKKLSSKTQIKAMNLVCADARIIDGEMQKKFVKSLEPNLDLQHAFVKLFDELGFTYNIGSLFRVRERFEKAVSVYQESLSQYVHDVNESDTKKGAIQHVATIEDMLSVLKHFEQEAIESHDMGTLLFTAEAEKSTGLLTLLTQKYDVVVMNPPYGDAPNEAKAYLKKHYPRTHYDYYAAFMEQAISLCKENGFVGMLTGRTFMFLKWFEYVRTQLLYKDARPVVVFDLNASPSDAVLDEATARWAATIVTVNTNSTEDAECQFFRLTILPGEEAKKSGLQEAISMLSKGDDHEIVYRVLLKDLRKLPRMPYSYWVPSEITELFSSFPPLDRDNAGKPNEIKIANLRVGLQTGNASQFVRFCWEVYPDKIARSRTETMQGKKWVPFTKGGDAYYSDAPLVVNWENDGQEIREFEKSVIRNEQYYFEKGIIWSDIVSSVLMDFRPLPGGHIFNKTTHSLFPESDTDYSTLIGLLNSSLFALLFLALDPTMHHRDIGYMCQMPISRAGKKNEIIADAVRKIQQLKSEWSKGDAISPNFTVPWILQALELEQSGNGFWKSFRDSNKTILSVNTFRALLDASINLEAAVLERVWELTQQIDTVVYNEYGVDASLQSVIDSELTLLRGFPKALKEDREKATKPAISKYEHVCRLLSFYIQNAINRDPDGILTLGNLHQYVIKQLSNDFGQNQIEETISAIMVILGKDVEEWIVRDFFSFYIGLFKRRPIIWQITSANYSRQKKTVGAINFFLDFHELDKDTLHKLRSKLLKAEIDAARWTLESLRERFSESKKADSNLAKQVNEAESILEELEKFDIAIKALSEPSKSQSVKEKSADWVTEKVAEIIVNGWSPVIDYGVLVNIKPLQEAGVLHNDARRIK